MSARLTFVCQTADKKDWAVDLCKQKGWKNVVAEQRTRLTVSYLRPEQRPYELEPRLYEEGNGLWIVSADADD
jgi:hypothetical protein